MKLTAFAIMTVLFGKMCVSCSRLVQASLLVEWLGTELSLNVGTHKFEGSPSEYVRPRDVALSTWSTQLVRHTSYVHGDIFCFKYFFLLCNRLSDRCETSKQIRDSSWIMFY